VSWDKFWEASKIRHYPGTMNVEKYIYTPGVHGLEFAKALIDGRILGMKCGDRVYVPPLTLCPDYEEGELVEVNGPWRIVTYTIIRETMDGSPLKEPEILAVIKPDNAEGGLIHRVKSDRGIHVGMEVKPVFKPRDERKGVITHILYPKWLVELV